LPVEIEAKVHVDNHEAVIARLKQLEAAPGPVLREVNAFFDTPNSSLKAADQGLRLRIEDRLDQPGRTIFITHKGPRSQGELKERRESEVEVGDSQGATDLLTALGYRVTLTFEKKRHRWTLDDCNIELDELPHLGCFIEIEGPDAETVMAVREKLQLDDEPLIRSSYIAMLDTYLAEHHLGRGYVALPNDEPE